jgi:hypothetical protein
MMKKEKIITEAIFGLVCILLIILFREFILKNITIVAVSIIFFVINYEIIVVIHEKKYKKNFPYKPYKSKKKIWERILIGLWAGVPFLFFIGSYNHKKYNTQAWYPETIECIFGNISQIIILVIYIAVAVKLFEFGWGYSLFFMVIPIITNIISIIINKNKR